MHIQLRPFQNSDKVALVQLANNYAIWKNVRNAFPHPYTPEAADQWLAQAQQQTPPNAFAIEVDGQFVGGIGLVPGVDISCKTAEVGYWIGEPFWGKGITSAALRQLIDIAFEERDFVMLFAYIFEYNTASMKVMEKNGFERKFVAPKTLWKENQLWDAHYYIKLK
jgi:[ribosomal protein S5]-alanine N-acetyltransferase